MEEKTKVENLEKIKKKNFLLVGSNFKYSIEKSYLRAFKKLGIKNIIFFNANKNFLLFSLSKILNKYILGLYYLIYRLILINFVTKNKKFDYIIIFKGLELTSETLKKIKKYQKKAKLINIFTDDPFNLKFASCSNKEILKSIKIYDFFCTSFSKKLNYKLKNYKVKKHIFLPFAYDQVLHFSKKIVNKNKILSKVNFVGAYDPERAFILNRLKTKVDVFGPGWTNSKIKNKLINLNNVFIHGAELKELFKKYAVSLNLLRRQDMESHNMKTFEIPSMGGLMLTYRNKEQNTFFKENQDCLMYSNMNELENKINFILKNKKKAFKIRKQGYKKVKNHTYTNRLKYLLKNIY